MRNLFANISMLVAALLLAVVIGENLTGYYLKRSLLSKTIAYIDTKTVSLSKQRDFSYKKFDPELGGVLNPGAEATLITSDFNVTYSINSHGLRDREFPLQSPEEEFRIIALGESTLFGEGVNYGDRITEVIEQALPKVEIINMGIGGFGFDQSLLQVKRDGFKFNPDAAVIFIFSQDYLDRCMDITTPGSTTAKPRFILSDDKNNLILQDPEHTRKDFEREAAFCKDALLGQHRTINEGYASRSGKPLYSRSNILTLMNYFAKRQRVDHQLRQNDAEYFKDTLGIVAWQNKRRQGYNAEDFDRLIFLLMVEYQKVFREHNLDFIIVNMSQSKLPEIEQACLELGVSYLDLSDKILHAAQSEPLQFVIDTHYNDKYHRIVAEHVSVYLKKKYGLGMNGDFKYRYWDGS